MVAGRRRWMVRGSDMSVGELTSVSSNLFRLNYVNPCPTHHSPNLIPWANGRSVPKLMVHVWRRMYAFQESDPDSRPPPVSFSPPKAPPISAPLVPMLTFAMPQSEPSADRNRSALRTESVKIALERP